MPAAAAGVWGFSSLLWLLFPVPTPGDRVLHQHRELRVSLGRAVQVRGKGSLRGIGAWYSRGCPHEHAVQWWRESCRHMITEPQACRAAVQWGQPFHVQPRRAMACPDAVYGICSLQLLGRWTALPWVTSGPMCVLQVFVQVFRVYGPDLPAVWKDSFFTMYLFTCLFWLHNGSLTQKSDFHSHLEETQVFWESIHKMGSLLVTSRKGLWLIAWSCL